MFDEKLEQVLHTTLVHDFLVVGDLLEKFDAL